MQTIIHYPASSGNITQWDVDPTEPIEDPTTQIQDSVDRTNDQTIIESIRRIDAKAFGEPQEPWTVTGISHTPKTTTIEAQDPITKYHHIYMIMWW